MNWSGALMVAPSATLALLQPKNALSFLLSQNISRPSPSTHQDRTMVRQSANFIMLVYRSTITKKVKRLVLTSARLAAPLAHTNTISALIATPDTYGAQTILAGLQ